MVTRKANICPIGHEKSRVPALDFFCRSPSGARFYKLLINWYPDDGKR